MRAAFSWWMLAVLFVSACSPDMRVGEAFVDVGLSSLQVTGGVLSPAFSAGTTTYTVSVPYSTNTVVVTATTFDSRGTVQVTGVEVASGVPCGPISIRRGPNPISLVALTPEGWRRRYDLIVWRAPDDRADYLKASDTNPEDYFGTSVALSDDTLAVGAPGKQLFASTSGAVYVFTRNGSSWTQQAYLKASNSDRSDRFGASVALSGDTLVVGAPEEDSSATGVNGNQADNSAINSGAVYVFRRSGAAWTQQAYLKASNTDSGDLFGTSVALSGDTLAVGAMFESSGTTGVNGNQADNSAPTRGAVYVFTRTGTVWAQQAYVKASNSGAELFGRVIALLGDTLAVSAPFESSKATGINGSQAKNGAGNSGAVYVFTRTGTAWAQQAYLKASNTDAGDIFGWSVALSGDTLAVGASGEDSSATGVNGNQADNSASHSGAVYVFTRSGTVWIQQAYLKASNTDEGDYFGESVALSGDTLVIGAGFEDSSATGINGNQGDNHAWGSGAVYIFLRNDTMWSQQAYIKANNGERDDGFGTSVALSGDTLAVGSIFEDSGATGVNGNQADNSVSGSGAVYVFR